MKKLLAALMCAGLALGIGGCSSKTLVKNANAITKILKEKNFEKVCHEVTADFVSCSIKNDDYEFILTSDYKKAEFISSFKKDAEKIGIDIEGFYDYMSDHVYDFELNETASAKKKKEEKEKKESSTEKDSKSTEEKKNTQSNDSDAVTSNQTNNSSNNDDESNTSKNNSSNQETSNSSNNKPSNESKPANNNASSVSLGKQNALQSAKSYINVMPFSYQGLANQLTYEGYLSDEITYAVDHCGANWNDQAVKAAKNYISTGMGFSYSGMIDQLVNGEDFTQSQAVYGADHCGADWNNEAAKSASNYISTGMSFSRDELINQLIAGEGFTQSQAEYGAGSVGY